MNHKYQMSSIVHYVSRAALVTATAFLILALAAVLFMNPAELERNIYYVVIGINVVIIVCAFLMDRYMSKSDSKLTKERKKKEKAKDNSPTISDWLDKH